MYIDKNSKLKDLINADKNTAKVFMKNHIHCLSCPLAMEETLENIANKHDVDINKLIVELNNIITKGEN
ncbi:MAG: DUF1858 domain-containing protein [Christensenellaceae bacterium]|nr:DUF1858 domain-containing protein [Christensenellaceae bacterium]